MTSAGAVFALVLLLGIGSVFALYFFVRAERDQRERMSREDAEREARRDTDDRPRRP